MTWWLQFTAGAIVVVVFWIGYTVYWMPRQQRKAGQIPPTEVPESTDVTEELLPRPEEASTFKRAFFYVGSLVIYIGGAALWALLGNWFMAGVWPTIGIMFFVSLAIAVRKHANK